MEEGASDLAELLVPEIWQNLIYLDRAKVILQKSLHVEERASDLAELPVHQQVC